MRVRLLAVAVLIPALASAQRGGGGGGTAGGSRQRGDPAADWNSINGGKGGIQLANRDVEDWSPLKLLIDKRKDLKLSDDQLKSLKDLEGKLKDQNDPSFHALDSLRRAAQPPLHAASDDDRVHMASARRAAVTVVGTIRENYDTSLAEALKLLDETQRPIADALIAQQRKDADEMLRAKLGQDRG